MSDTDQTRMMSTPPLSGATMAMPAGGATMQMPAGFDPMRTQMGGTTTCPVCKMTTPLAEPYCGDCGFLLSSTPAEEIALPPEEAPAAELVDAADGRRYKLRSGPNTIGRQGTDILTTEGTVSRVHAQVIVEGTNIVVEDLGSTNGTKVGDQRIGPNQPTPAAHGTPLRFGSWRLTLEVGGVSSAATIMGASQTLMGSGTIMGGAVPTPISEPTLMNAPPVVPALPIPGEAQAPSDADVLEAVRASARGEEAVPLMPAPVSGGLIAIFQKLDGSGDDIPVFARPITLGRKAENTVQLTSDPYISGRHAEIVTEATGTYLTDVGSTNGTLINGSRLAPNQKQLLLEGDEVQFGQTKYKFVFVGTEPTETPAETTAAEEPQA